VVCYKRLHHIPEAEGACCQNASFQGLGRSRHGLPRPLARALRPPSPCLPPVSEVVIGASGRCFAKEGSEAKGERGGAVAHMRPPGMNQLPAQPVGGAERQKSHPSSLYARWSTEAR